MRYEERFHAGFARDYLPRYTLLIDGSDNFSTRYAAADAADQGADFRRGSYGGALHRCAGGAGQPGTAPLREEATRKALVEAVLDGTIDCITSDHNPLDIELKKLEFDLAKDGTIGLESAFGALETVLPTEVIVAKFTAAKSYFNIENNTIAEGNKAELTLFNPNEDWVFSKENILSFSKNSIMLGKKMKGKVYGIISNNKIEI